jgi:hypothetical protein
MKNNTTVLPVTGKKFGLEANAVLVLSEECETKSQHKAAKNCLKMWPVSNIGL